MFELEDSLWWYAGMRRIVDGMLRRHLGSGSPPLAVLDSGCGTGGSLSLLERYGRVTAFDFSKRAAEMFATRRTGRILVASTDAVPFADASFDLVTSFDVVCQIEAPGDEAALAELARVLKPGGTLVVRVPALQMLHGSHDITLQTQHRYTRGELATKVRRTGLEVQEATYANTILFPVAFGRRMLAKLRHKAGGESDVRPVAEPLNRALLLVLSLEAAILTRTRLPIGLSVIALARKP